MDHLNASNTSDAYSVRNVADISTKRVSSQATERAPMAIKSKSSSSYDKIGMRSIVSSTSILYSVVTMPVSHARHETDPEIAAMSDDELIAETKKLFGAWADRDDFGDNWRDDLWAGWDMSQIVNDGQNISSIPT